MQFGVMNMGELFANLGINWKLLLAQAVNFLLVLWLLNRFVFKKLIKFLDERKQRISKGIEMSDRAKRELERIEEMRRRFFAEIRREGELLINNAKATAQRTAQQILSEAHARQEEILRDAQKDAEIIKKQGIEQGRREIEKIGLILAEKILRRSLTPLDQERFLEETLKEIEK